MSTITLVKCKLDNKQINTNNNPNPYLLTESDTGNSQKIIIKIENKNKIK